jgi:hypothetical protein
VFGEFFDAQTIRKLTERVLCSLIEATLSFRDMLGCGLWSYVGQNRYTEHLQAQDMSACTVGRPFCSTTEAALQTVLTDAGFEVLTALTTKWNVTPCSLVLVTCFLLGLLFDPENAGSQYVSLKFC